MTICKLVLLQMCGYHWPCLLEHFLSWIFVNGPRPSTTGCPSGNGIGSCKELQHFTKHSITSDRSILTLCCTTILMTTLKLFCQRSFPISVNRFLGSWVEIYGFCDLRELVSRLGHPSQVLALTCVDLRDRLARALRQQKHLAHPPKVRRNRKSNTRPQFFSGGNPHKMAAFVLCC